MDGAIIDRTVEAIKRQIQTSAWKGRPAKTVFFGGGTPTFIKKEQLAELLRTIKDIHPTTESTEVTSEANPGTADAEKFAAMRDAGFSRISLGAQSFHQPDLIQLGRIHHASDVARAVALARAAGFDNINLDLMFALPGQSQRAWRQNLETAFQLNPEHLSLYCLTIEPNTRFHHYAHRGMLNLPDEESQVQMYDTACELAGQSGYDQYEISNFAKPGRESQHNLCYWRGEEYLAYGPGAVGCFATEAGRTRYTNTKHPERYCVQVENDQAPWCDQEQLTENDLALERLMLGIRLNEGLDTETTELDKKGLDKVLANDWARIENDRIILTSRGRHFCSEAIAYLAP